MTLDEAIKHAEEVAKQNEEDAVIYSNCKNHKKNLYEIGLAESAEKKCRKCAEEHRQLAEWLKELRWLREQTRWTPCSERLPRSFETVNVTVQIPEGRYVKESALVNGIWEGINGYAKVVAWMPLPEPYKEDADG